MFFPVLEFLFPMFLLASDLFVFFNQISETKKEAANKKAAAGASSAAVLLGRQRVSCMFAAASGASALRKTNPTVIKANPSADNILEDVLADIMVDDADRERERLRRRGGN